LEQTSVGASAALVGVILLLLLGTQLLEWYWLVVLFVAGAGISAWRTLHQLPTPYRVAQLIDRRLDLHDALSTAWHFSHAEAPPHAAGDILQAQRQHAELLAASALPSHAVPLRLPRQVYALCAIAAVAGALFILRYGIRGSLDLSQPLVEAVADFFRPGKEVIARTKKPPKLPGEDPLGIALDSAERKQEELDAAPDSALQETLTPDVNQADPRAHERSQKSQVKAQSEDGDEWMEGEDEGERSKGDSGREGEGQAAGKQPGAEPSQKNAQQQGSNPGDNQENSSLLDKMRDAMANLMSKLKIPPQAGPQSTQASKDGQSSGKREQASQKGKPGEGKPQGKGTPSEDQESDMNAQGEQQAQAGQGKSADKNAGENGSNESKSGMGKQDGEKAIKDAEQLAAMGKLSEIFGKRASTVTGEIMVEVSSGKQQQLRTAYSKSGAAHKESGGEIRRDEIPLELQHYVQQYFEQLRKSEPQPEGAAAPTSPRP